MSRYLDRDDVLGLSGSIDVEGALREVLVEAVQGTAEQLVRQELLPQSASGVLGIMPSFSSQPSKAFAAKVVCVMPDNPGKGRPAHQGVAMLFEGDTGRLIGMAEAGAVTEVRTAAMAALATRTLARRSAEGHFLLVGAGYQGLPHLLALSKVPGSFRQLVWARRKDAAERIAEQARGLGIEVGVATDLEAAVRAADVVTLITGAKEPLLQAAWLKEGAHVNAMGSSTPRVREFGHDVIERCTVFVDHVPSVYSLAGEFASLDAPPAGTELGEVLARKQAGRLREDQNTLFKSVGMALQDLALLRKLFELAQEQGVGQSIAL